MDQKLNVGTIWITGLSASGKSTLGGKLFNDLKAIGVNNVMFLDGESIREEFGGAYGYGKIGRASCRERV